MKYVKSFLVLTVSAAVYAAGISLFLDPNGLAPGGVTGISILLNRVTGVETGTLILLLNIPIMAVGWWKFGYRLIVSTIYCTVLASGFTNLFGRFGALTEDLFLAAVTGSALIAFGMGTILKNRATTGGTDIIVKLLRRRMPYIKTGTLLLSMDALVVTASAFVLRDIERALYAGVAVFITAVVLDLVLYGKDGAKMIYIISDCPGQIAGRILKELEIGVTYVKGMGAYSGKAKQVIFCVVRKNLSARLENIVKDEDETAFMIVCSATEIYGEGYKNLFGEKI